MERNIWNLSLIFILVFWLGGCSMQYSEEELRHREEGELFLVLNVDASHSGGGYTRAVNDPASFEPAEFNTEKMQSLRVIIIDDQNGSETQNKIIFNDHSLLNNSIRISGWKYKIDFYTKYKVYLIANEAGLPDAIQATLSSLKVGSDCMPETLENIDISNQVNIESGSALINNEKSFLTGDEVPKPIPMTEVFTVDPIARPNADSNQEVIKVNVEKDMFIIRAASKFSFYIKKKQGQADGNYGSIKSIRITGIGKKEYLFPNGTEYDPNKTEESNNPYGGREITDFKVPSEGNEPGSYDFVLPQAVDISSITDEYSFCPQIYFPEGFGISKETPFQCSISYVGDDGEFFLEPVTLDNLPNLPRNTHVKVIITVSGHSIDAAVTVVPYTGVILDPFFGLEEKPIVPPTPTE